MAMSRCRLLLPVAGILTLIAAGQSHAAVQRGQASWYGSFHEGKLMADHQPFRMMQATVAYRTLPLGTIVKLRNPACRVLGRKPAMVGQLTFMGRRSTLASHLSLLRPSTAQQGRGLDAEREIYLPVEAQAQAEARPLAADSEPFPPAWCWSSLRSASSSCTTLNTASISCCAFSSVIGGLPTSRPRIAWLLRWQLGHKIQTDATQLLGSGFGPAAGVA